jgi:hypothetical protein
MSSAQTRSQLERPPRAFRSGRVPGETLSAISYSAKQPAATGAGCSFERGGGGGDGGGGDGGDGDGRGGEGCGGEEGGGVAAVATAAADSVVAVRASAMAVVAMAAVRCMVRLAGHAC